MSDKTKNVAATFSCNLCPRMFLSWQAVGGHQNAHHKERYALKCLENENKMTRAREAHGAQLLLPRPPCNSGCFNGLTAQSSIVPIGHCPNAPGPVQQLLSDGGVGGSGQGPKVDAGPSSFGSEQVEDETLDLTLKL